MRLSLLRSPKSPDAHADMGLHNFRYALLPHAGQLDHNVVRAAYNFNHQLHLVRGNPTSGNVFKTFTLTGSPSLVISAIKRFEDDKDVSRGFLPIRGKKDSKSVIIRVYDSLGGKSRGHIVSKRAIAGAWKTNILEDDQEQLDVLSDSDKDKIPIQLRPFEVATYRLELA
jgi:alpha-mannosidase